MWKDREKGKALLEVPSGGAAGGMGRLFRSGRLDGRSQEKISDVRERDGLDREGQGRARGLYDTGPN